MGCYDSSLLRPLLFSSSSSSNNGSNNNSINNNANNNTRQRWFTFWQRSNRRGYNDMEEEDCDLDGLRVKYGRKKRNKGVLDCDMIMSAGRKVKLLVWKNLLLRRRHYIVTALEILLPTLFSMVLVYGRAQASSHSPLSHTVLETIKVHEPDVFAAVSENDYRISCGTKSCLVAFAPDTKDTREVINMMIESLDSKAKREIEWRPFNSESDIEKFVASLSFNEVTGGNETLRAAIVFKNNFGSKDAFEYKIRMMDDTFSFPSEIINSDYPWLQLPGPDFSNLNRYKESGFTSFQIKLDNALLRKFTGRPKSQTVYLQAFPYPPYDKSPNFSELYFIILPNVIILGFIFIVPSIVRGVVNERETGIKELMKLCGIPNWLHWLAWTVNSMLFLSISVTIVIVLFFTDLLNPEAGPIMTRSNPLVWWLVLCLYVLASTAFCFFISSFFQRPTIAITVGIILWLTTYYLPSVPLGDTNRYLRLSLFEKMSVALLPNMALYWALKVMCGFEGKASGAQWHNLFEPLSSTDTLTLGHVMFMFIVDTVFYLLLTLYVEAVVPSPYGTRKPWYFIFKPTSWGLGSSPSGYFESEEDEETVKPGFEPEPNGLRAGVAIRNLKKKFGRGKVAVDGMSVKMYDGEIFALLGHNGAGKSTTISCCIGMMAPSSGTAVINGYDIRADMDRVREQLGLCPQHNLLFDELTVDQHLTFFGSLKGIKAEEAKKERVEMLQKLQLSDKTDALAGTLSGGQKRKLSLGIALIGKAKTVFLDEPTSGMDVEARRAIWDLLLSERGQRTIILTTHFMEEADVLGDRIGIMAHGKLQCCGTSLFLKKYYGAGYTLSLTMSSTDRESKNNVLAVVQDHVPGATLKVDSHITNPHEFGIMLPTESCSTAVFPKLFKQLQDRKQALGIRTIGLSLTTMDEVFIKVDEGASLNKSGDVQYVQDISNSNTASEVTSLKNRNHRNTGSVGDFSDPESKLGSENPKLQGLRLVRQQFEGLIIKRFNYTLRKWKLILTQVSIPVFILIIAILAGNTSLQPPSSPKPMKIQLSSYKKPITLYSTTDEYLGKAYKDLVGSSAKQFVSNGSTNIVQELIRIGEQDLAIFRERHIVAADLSPSQITALYSTIPYHAAPLSLNLVTNAILRSSSPSGPKIEAINHPLQAGFDYLLQALQPDPAFSVTNALMFGALAPIGLALLAASYIVSPLEERLCKGKQLQFMTGVHPIIYWSASFVWDFLVIALVIIVMVICFPVFQKADTYTSYGGAGVIFVILLTYGFAAIPFSYIWSLFAGTVPGGFSFVTIIHIGTGMILPFVVYVLEVAPGLTSIADTVRLVGRFFPTFGASLCTMRFVEIALKNSRCSLLPDNAETLLCDANVQLKPIYRQCCSNCGVFEGTNCMKPLPYITWMYKRAEELPMIGSQGGGGVPGIGQELLFMLLLGMAYLAILVLLELGFLQYLVSLVFRTKIDAFQSSSGDDDVDAESDRIHNLVREGKVGEDALVVENLCKNYGSLAAVANLNFGVHHGECFGLLGTNAAGKTTSFRMLTGDEFRSNGSAYASGCTLDTSRKRFLAKLGYCPQFDGIVGVLTGREMVELFARLRGVENISKDSEKWLARVGLSESMDIQCRKYSGGMKRRLSAAIAMVGDPEIVLLDEPTSGVDPVSRRDFWKIIAGIKESGRAIILTSHSMDEIAACCSRLGIMVNGQLQCIGGVQHLKNKFAQGYTLSIKLKTNGSGEAAGLLDVLEKEIPLRFHPCILKDKHQTALQYHIQNASLPWDVLFGTMESLKGSFHSIIEDYSITETTLEEVFLAFARKQYSNREANVSILQRIVTCQIC